MIKDTESRKNSRITQETGTECKTYYLDDKLVNADPPISLITGNISEGGVGVVSQMPLTIDSVLIFNIAFGFDTYKVMAKVVWSKENEGGYISGLEFVSIPHDLKKALGFHKELA